MITEKTIYELELDLGNHSALFIGAFDEKELRDSIFPQFMEMMQTVKNDQAVMVETSMSQPELAVPVLEDEPSWQTDEIKNYNVKPDPLEPVIPKPMEEELNRYKKLVDEFERTMEDLEATYRKAFKALKRAKRRLKCRPDKVRIDL